MVSTVRAAAEGCADVHGLYSHCRTCWVSLSMLSLETMWEFMLLLTTKGRKLLLWWYFYNCRSTVEKERHESLLWQPSPLLQKKKRQSRQTGKSYWRELLKNVTEMLKCSPLEPGSRSAFTATWASGVLRNCSTPGLVSVAEGKYTFPLRFVSAGGKKWQAPHNVKENQDLPEGQSHISRVGTV